MKKILIGRLSKEESIRIIEAEKDPVKKMMLQDEFINWHVDGTILAEAFRQTTRNLYEREKSSIAV